MHKITFSTVPMEAAQLIQDLIETDDALQKAKDNQYKARQAFTALCYDNAEWALDNDYLVVKYPTLK